MILGKNFSNLMVILVEPNGPLNVGSVARLCSNFEVDELRIVSPKCDIFSLEAKKIIKPVKEKLKKDLSKFIFGADNDTLPSVLIKELTKRNETIVFAESSTGGLLSSSLTSISGSSQVFQGSIVSYSNELKNSLLNISKEKLTKYGAVSEEVCEAMAINVKEKLGADWAIAISGIAGPNGGSQDKPVGLVYISISGPNNHITNIKKLFNSTRNRIEIQRLSVNVCLNSLRLILLSNSK